MKIFKGLLYAISLLLVVLLAAGLLLPNSAHVVRSVNTAASPDTVYAIVNGFARFNEWSPWADLDPKTRYSYSGPATGVGAKMAWASEKPDVGSGSQEILAVDPGRRVTTRLVFGDQGAATSTMDIAPAPGGSLVTWSFDTSFEGNFLGRYFGLFFDRMIGPDFEKGLSRLKALAEAAPPGPDSTAPPSP
jgi:hypothetical protein